MDNIWRRFWLEFQCACGKSTESPLISTRLPTFRARSAPTATGTYNNAVINNTTNVRTFLYHSVTPKTLEHFTFWTSLSLRPKAETKRLNFGLRLKLRLTNHCGAHHCSLHNVIADIIADVSVFLYSWVIKEVIFVHQNLISNRLNYLVHAKSTDEYC